MSARDPHRRSQDARRDEFARRLAPHRASLVIVARRMTATESDAEDVLQAALLSAWRGFAGEAEPDVANFGGWIYRHVANECRNHARREAKRFGREAPFEEPEAPGAGVFEALERDLEGAGTVLDPERVLERIDERLSSALSALQEDERLAFLLRSVADLDTAEIAAATDAPKGTVMSRVFRAREKLRARLASDRDLAPLSRRSEP